MFIVHCTISSQFCACPRAVVDVACFFSSEHFLSVACTSSFADSVSVVFMCCVLMHLTAWDERLNQRTSTPSTCVENINWALNFRYLID